MKKKILVLGHKGMLGHMLCKVLLKENNIVLSTSSMRFPDWNKKLFENQDFIINCIGAVRQKKDANFDINWEIPMWLENNISSQIIYPGTDCEIDEDAYGISKRKASQFILEFGKKTKIIKSSYIGPELNSNYGLMDWFLSQTGDVDGYTKAIWNGVTTYEWAKQCIKLINEWEERPVLNILYSNKVSKYKLLIHIKECYDKRDVMIVPKRLGKDKSLVGNVKTKDIDKQIKELIEFNNG